VIFNSAWSVNKDAREVKDGTHWELESLIMSGWWVDSKCWRAFKERKGSCDFVKLNLVLPIWITQTFGHQFGWVGQKHFF
jgi:hypothetical protein